MKLFIFALLALQAMAQFPRFRRGFPLRRPGTQEPVAPNPENFHPDELPGFYTAPQDPRQFQTAAFVNVDVKVTINWAGNSNLIVSPFNTNTASAAELKTLVDASADDQKWIFTEVKQAVGLYNIYNAKSKLYLTYNGYPSPVALSELGNNLNQRFRVIPNQDGTFFVATGDSELYLDALIVNAVNPVVIVRNFEGDITQKWIINTI